MLCTDPVRTQGCLYQRSQGRDQQGQDRDSKQEEEDKSVLSFMKKIYVIHLRPKLFDSSQFHGNVPHLLLVLDRVGEGRTLHGSKREFLFAQLR